MIVDDPYREKIKDEDSLVVVLYKSIPSESPCKLVKITRKASMREHISEQTVKSSIFMPSTGNTALPVMKFLNCFKVNGNMLMLVTSENIMFYSDMREDMIKLKNISF